jgi:membrane fusion protein (multidrug efflux system)
MSHHLARRVAVLLTLSAVACDGQKQQAAQQSPPPAVGVIVAAKREITAGTDFTGRVEAVDKVELRARISGFLEQRLFTEGQDVKDGDLLFVIEKGPYAAEVEQRKAAIAHAEAELRNASLQLERGRELLRNNNIPTATVDERAAAEAMAQANLLQAKAALQQAAINLGYTEITSPVAGRIGRAAYSIGNFVSPESGTLALIVSQDPIHVTFPVSQRQLLEARAQQLSGETAAKQLVVHARLPDGSVYPHPGRLSFLGVQVDRGTDTVAVRADFPNPDRILVDGQFVGVTVQRERPELAITVPQAAIQIDQAGPYVLIVDAEKKVGLRRVSLAAGGRDGEAVVEKGLAEGESVLVEGAQKVRPGQVVNPSAVEAPLKSTS